MTAGDALLGAGVLLVLVVAGAAVVRTVADWNLKPTAPHLVGPPVEVLGAVVIIDEVHEHAAGEIEAALEFTPTGIFDGLGESPPTMFDGYVEDDIARTVRRVYFQ